MTTANTETTTALADMMSQSNSALNGVFDTISAVVAQGTDHARLLDGLRVERNAANFRLDELRARLQDVQNSMPTFNAGYVVHDRPNFSQPPSKRGRHRQHSNNQRMFNVTGNAPSAQTPSMAQPPLSSVPTQNVLFVIARLDQDGPTMARMVADRAPGLTAAAINHIRWTVVNGNFVVHFRTQAAATSFLGTVAASPAAQSMGVTAAYAGSADVLGDLFPGSFAHQGN